MLCTTRTVVLATLVAALMSLAVPASADNDPNKGTVNAILGALLEHNPFTVRDPNSHLAYAQLDVGPYGFEVNVLDYEQLLNCGFTYYERDADDGNKKGNTEVTYFDYGCIGPLDKVTIGNSEPKPPAANDQLAYRGFLRFLSKLVPAMQAYVPDVSTPNNYTLGMDFALRAKNRGLLETILRQMEQTRVTTIKGNNRTIVISGTNKMLMALAGC